MDPLTSLAPSLGNLPSKANDCCPPWSVNRIRSPVTLSPSSVNFGNPSATLTTEPVHLPSALVSLTSQSVCCSSGLRIVTFQLPSDGPSAARVAPATTSIPPPHRVQRLQTMCSPLLLSNPGSAA